MAYIVHLVHASSYTWCMPQEDVWLTDAGMGSAASSNTWRTRQEDVAGVWPLGSGTPWDVRDRESGGSSAGGCQQETCMYVSAADALSRISLSRHRAKNCDGRAGMLEALLEALGRGLDSSDPRLAWTF